MLADVKLSTYSMPSLRKMFQVELNEVTFLINHLYPTSETETADEEKRERRYQVSNLKREEFGE